MANQILKDHLKTPTFRDVVDIAYDSIDSKGECADKIKRILLMSGATSFYGFTGVLNSQERVVYIQDHPDVIDNKIVMEESDLVKRLEVKDRSVRFVPFGFKIGEMTSRQLAQNEFVRALAEEEGAEKLAEIANRYRPGINTVLLLSGRLIVPGFAFFPLFGHWFCVGGNAKANNSSSGVYTFGVERKTNETR